MRFGPAVDARARHYSGAPASLRRHGHSISCAGARFGIRVLCCRRRRTATMPYEPSFPHCVRDKTCGMTGGSTCSRGTTPHMPETTGGWGSVVARSCEQILRCRFLRNRGGAEVRIDSLRRPSAATGSAGVTSPAPRAPAFAILLPFTLCTMLALVQHQHRSKNTWHHAASPSFSRCCVRFTVSRLLVFADMCTHRPQASSPSLNIPGALLQSATAHACALCSLMPANIVSSLRT